MRTDTILIAGVGVAAVLAIAIATQTESKWGPPDLKPEEFLTEKFDSLVIEATKHEGRAHDWLTTTCPPFLAAHAQQREKATAAGQSYLPSMGVFKCREFLGEK